MELTTAAGGFVKDSTKLLLIEYCGALANVVNDPTGNIAKPT